MKKVVALFLFAFLLSGCTNIREPATPTVEFAFTLVPTLVVENTPEGKLDIPDYLPQPFDNQLEKARALTNSIYVVFSNTDPAEVILHINGYLPTPCHELRIAIPDPDENGDIFIEVYSLVEPNQDCEQVLRAYDVTVNLGTYPSGSYWVWVNGGRVGNFDY